MGAGGVLRGVAVMLACVCSHLRTNVSVRASPCEHLHASVGVCVCVAMFACSLTVVDAIGTVVGTVVGAFGNL